MSYIKFKEQDIRNKSDIVVSLVDYNAFSRMCYFNAFLNNKLIFKSKNLKIKMGYCAIIAEGEMLEIGYTKDDPRKPTIKKMFNETEIDAHVWLEDADGNIYDHVQGCYILHLRQNGIKNKLKHIRFEGVSKMKLKKDLGLVYEAYDDIYWLCYEKYLLKKNEKFKFFYDMLNN